MAVPKGKVSKARRDKRRNSHWKLAAPRPRKCPKCGGKLGIFDLKPNCPHCGCSIMYYDMDKRLEEDSVKAEAEWQKLDEILDKITPAFIKKKRAAREEKEKNEKDSSEK